MCVSNVYEANELVINRCVFIVHFGCRIKKTESSSSDRIQISTTNKTKKRMFTLINEMHRDQYSY